MSAINDVLVPPTTDMNAVNQDRLKKAEMGQDQFMKLMIAQMNYQNPMEPQSNTEFLSQMAQFGTVEGIRELQGSVTNMSQSLQSNQALQASMLVGRSVVIPTNTFDLTADHQVSGTVDLPGHVKDLNVGIYSDSGVLIKEISLGDHLQGSADFIWDGKNTKGETMPSGKYKMIAEGVHQDAHASFSTNLTANVDSVSIGKDGSGIALHVAGLGLMPFDSVNRIK